MASQLPKDLREPVQNQTNFSLTLTKNLISTQAIDKNLVFSPLSIHVVLSILATGSNGPTRDQILGILESSSISELTALALQVTAPLFEDLGPLGGPCFSCANGLWVERSLKFKPCFKYDVENDYKAVARNVDFKNKAEEARQKINKWADKKTNGLITEILPPNSVDEETLLVFGNAIYFKGTWEETFDRNFNCVADFYLLNGSPIEVPFMNHYSSNQYIRAFNDFKVLKLPYRRGRDVRQFSMYIFLPKARDGLPASVEKVCSEPRFIENHLPKKQVLTGYCRIPKFKISFGFDAKKLLTQMGLILPFVKLGTISEMVDYKYGLDVKAIFHKSFIKVDEEGTEAAAVTMLKLCGGGGVPDNLEKFVADHPFLFCIREDTTGVVVFVGQVLNPVAE